VFFSSIYLPTQYFAVLRLLFHVDYRTFRSFFLFRFLLIHSYYQFLLYEKKAIPFFMIISWEKAKLKQKEGNFRKVQQTFLALFIILIILIILTATVEWW